jgi:hypothetical protein
VGVVDEDNETMEPSFLCKLTSEPLRMMYMHFELDW